MAFIVKLSASLDVPRRSIHLNWGRVESTPECVQSMPASSSAVACTKRVTIDVVVLHMEKTDEVWGETISECCCCGDPCVDVDDLSDREREDNCTRCITCMLCISCRVDIPHVGPLCMQCVEDTFDQNAEFLSPAQGKRYYLTEAAWKRHVLVQ